MEKHTKMSEAELKTLSVEEVHKLCEQYDIQIQARRMPKKAALIKKLLQKFEEAEKESKTQMDVQEQGDGNKPESKMNTEVEDKSEGGANESTKVEGGTENGEAMETEETEKEKGEQKSEDKKEHTGTHSTKMSEAELKALSVEEVHKMCEQYAIKIEGNRMPKKAALIKRLLQKFAQPGGDDAASKEPKTQMGVQDDPASQKKGTRSGSIGNLKIDISQKRLFCSVGVGPLHHEDMQNPTFKTILETTLTYSVHGTNTHANEIFVQLTFSTMEKATEMVDVLKNITFSHTGAKVERLHNSYTLMDLIAADDPAKNIDYRVIKELMGQRKRKLYNYVVYVENLPPNVKEDVVREIFDDIDIKHVIILDCDADGNNKGIALLIFNSAIETVEALLRSQKRQYKGKDISTYVMNLEAGKAVYNAWYDAPSLTAGHIDNILEMFSQEKIPESMHHTLWYVLNAMKKVGLQYMTTFDIKPAERKDRPKAKKPKQAQPESAKPAKPKSDNKKQMERDRNQRKDRVGMNMGGRNQKGREMMDMDRERRMARDMDRVGRMLDNMENSDRMGNRDRMMGQGNRMGGPSGMMGMEMQGGMMDRRGMMDMDRHGGMMDMDRLGGMMDMGMHGGMRDMEIRGGMMDRRGMMDMDRHGGMMDMDRRGGMLDINRRGMMDMDRQGGMMDRRGMDMERSSRMMDVGRRGMDMERRGGMMDSDRRGGMDMERQGGMTDLDRRWMDMERRRRMMDLDSRSGMDMERRGRMMDLDRRGGMDMERGGRVDMHTHGGMMDMDRQDRNRPSGIPDDDFGLMDSEMVDRILGSGVSRLVAEDRIRKLSEVLSSQVSKR